MTEFASEMRLFDPASGQRLYMDARERELFLNAANEQPSRGHRLFCQVLHWTGARITEALELTGDRINFDRCSITLRTIKKNKLTKQGQVKAPVYRQIPVPAELIDALDLLFDLRGKHRRRCASLALPLWPNQNDPKRPMSRATGWRVVKRVLDAAGIEGPQASPKGFRHGFGVAMALGGRDIYTLQKLMGHERPETTAIYLQVVGQEAHDLQMSYWNQANKSWGKQ